MALEIPFTSKEFFRVPLRPFKVAGEWVDPSSATVQMAFLISGDPAGGDWKTAQWETDETVTPPVHTVTCLVGGTGTGAVVELPRGSYTAWLRVTESPEVPVREVGRLEVI